MAKFSCWIEKSPILDDLSILNIFFYLRGKKTLASTVIVCVCSCFTRRDGSPRLISEISLKIFFIYVKVITCFYFKKHISKPSGVIGKIKTPEIEAIIQLLELLQLTCLFCEYTMYMTHILGLCWIICLDLILFKKKCYANFLTRKAWHVHHDSHFVG